MKDAGAECAEAVMKAGDERSRAASSDFCSPADFPRPASTTLCRRSIYVQQSGQLELAYEMLGSIIKILLSSRGTFVARNRSRSTHSLERLRKSREVPSTKDPCRLRLWLNICGSGFAQCWSPDCPNGGYQDLILFEPNIRPTFIPRLDK